MLEKKNLNLILLLGWCSIIFLLSHLSAADLPAQLDQHSHAPSASSFLSFLAWDKLHHATAYAIMAFFAWRFFSHHAARSFQLFTITFVFCSLYGISDEWHQSFIAGRESDAFDWLADTIGASIFLSFIYLKELQPEFTEITT